MTKQLATVQVNDVVTEFIKSMIKLSEDPRQVMVGVHNAFVFGDIFDEIDFDITEGELAQIFEGLEIIDKALDETKTN